MFRPKVQSQWVARLKTLPGPAVETSALYAVPKWAANRWKCGRNGLNAFSRAFVGANQMSIMRRTIHVFSRQVSGATGYFFLISEFMTAGTPSAFSIQNRRSVVYLDYGVRQEAVPVVAFSEDATMKTKSLCSFAADAIAADLMASGVALAQRQGGGHEGNAAGPVAAPAPQTRAPASPGPADRNVNRDVHENQPGILDQGRRDESQNRNGRERELGRSEDWRTLQSGGRWWYWGPDNRWSYWNDGQWMNYDESATGSGEQSAQTAPQGYGGDGCGCAASAPSCSSGCGSSCNSGCGECGCCHHRHHHHRHRRCC